MRDFSTSTAARIERAKERMSEWIAIVTGSSCGVLGGEKQKGRCNQYPCVLDQISAQWKL